MLQGLWLPPTPSIPTSGPVWGIEQKQREQDFADYQVNESLMAAAPEHAIFLHCLPAKRGQEVTDAVMDGAQSRVVAQAGNRMHAQKGLLVWLLNKQL